MNIELLKDIDRFTRQIDKTLPPLPRAEEARRPLWRDIARPEQLPPTGDWFTWLILAGRGWGKTRTGAETILEMARNTPNGRFALITNTIGDVRDTMVEGETGILQYVAPSELRGGSVDEAWNRSLTELYLANGAKFKGFSSEKPRQLRGPQHHGAWGDEPATWLDAGKGTAEDTTYSNLLFGLRLGDSPRLILTGTPRPTRLIREILKDADTVVSRGSTYDNLGNLAATYKEKIIKRFEGTRLGRQELEGELLEDTPGALWHYGMFEKPGFRLTETPELKRIVIAVDPAVSSGEDSDETGIIAAGLGFDGRAYILRDESMRGSPNDWALMVSALYKSLQADRVIAERNNGGEMVEAVLRTAAPELSYKSVWASRGKRTRAEPVAALYEQGKVSHVGVFPEFETQLATWQPGEPSPDRLDSGVWALTELMLEYGPTFTPKRHTTIRVGSN